jgi:hypothetical protein
MHASMVFRIDRIASNPMIACRPPARHEEVSTALSAGKQGINMTGAKMCLLPCPPRPSLGIVPWGTSGAVQYMYFFCCAGRESVI